MSQNVTFGKSVKCLVNSFIGREGYSMLKTFPFWRETASFLAVTGVEMAR